MENDELKTNGGSKNPLVIAILVSVIVLPIYSQLVGILIVNMLFSDHSQTVGAVIFVSAVYCSLIGLAGFVYGRFSPVSASWRIRYLPFIVAILYAFLVWLSLIFAVQGDTQADLFRHTLGFAFIPFSAAYVMAIFTNEWLMFMMLIISSYVIFLLFYIWAIKGLGYNTHLTYRRIGCAILLLMLLSVATVYQWQSLRHWVFTPADDDYVVVREETDLSMYNPFSNEMLLTPLRGQPALTFSDDYPRLDCQSATYALCASVVNALYETDYYKDELIPYISSSIESQAYQRLIDGEVDLIIMPQASEQLAKALFENGVALKYRLIAKDAFVFINRKQNPVSSLNIAQIQDIYSGKISNWHDVGGENEEIMAFQRQYGSMSQMLMESGVMQGQLMLRPLKQEYAEYVNSIGGVYYQPADYHNYPTALGYSTRFYVNRINKHPDVQLLAIDNIAPTAENIRNGSYSFTLSIYAVTLTEPSTNTQKLVEWISGEQGQQLIEDNGYVPLINVQALNTPIINVQQ